MNKLRRLLKRDERFKVQINYSNGTSMIIKCSEFSVKRSALGSKEFSWAGAKPNPLLIGIDNIISIWQL